MRTTDVLSRRWIIPLVLLTLALAGWGVAHFSAQAATAAGPTLTIPSQALALPESPVTLTLTFEPVTATISSIVFSLDFDPTWLTFDATDADLDGLPDAVTFHAPGAFFTQVTYDPADSDGELDFMVADLAPPLAALPGGNLVSITFTTGQTLTDVETPVLFSTEPPVSFGSTTGGSVPGAGIAGSVLISPQVVTTTVSPSPTDTETPTPTSSPTITQTPTPPDVYLPVILRQLPPTATLTPTPTSTQPGDTITPTTTPTATATPTSSSTPPSPSPTPTQTQFVCTNLLRNSGFETKTDWDRPATEYTADYSDAQKHAGLESMRVGIINLAHNKYAYSSARQQVSIPAGVGSASLQVWLYTVSGESSLRPLPARPLVGSEFGNGPLAFDAQYVMVLNNSGDVVETLFWERDNTQSWQQHTFDLQDYAGETIMIMFGAFNDGYDGVTGMYVDDAVLTVCP